MFILKLTLVVISVFKCQVMPKAQLIYFKTSGKFYEEASLDLLPEELGKNGIALMFKIVQRIKTLSQKKELPGIICDWLKEEGSIFVNVPDIGYPHLIKTIKKVRNTIVSGKMITYKVKIF